MPRYKLTIEYDGTPFVGLQAQDNGVSVQGMLTGAVAAFAGEQVAIGDVCFKRDDVFAMELGGPEVGRGCG